MSVQIEEGWHTVEDGTKLYTKSWKPSSPPRARLLFIHGFSDHCNNYEFFFNYLVSQGIEVYSFDQRGWGRSVQTHAQRGLTGPTQTVLSDITSLFRTLIPSPVPLYMMGHSMGGAETLVYASQGPPEVLSKIRGFVSSAPLIELHPNTKPWRLTVVMGRLAGRVLPRRQLVNRLRAELLSHDVEQNKLWEADALCHDTGTLEGLAGMLDRGEQLHTGKIVVKEGVGEGGKTRLLVLHGTEDGINDFRASEGFVAKCEVEDKTLKAYEGLYHNMHAELGDAKTTFASDVARWILDRADAPTSSSQPKL